MTSFQALVQQGVSRSYTPKTHKLPAHLNRVMRAPRMSTPTGLSFTFSDSAAGGKAWGGGTGGAGRARRQTGTKAARIMFNFRYAVQTC